ncbi:hypothetical protein JXM83_06925 [Candidatus Woesearchaeota archaeon]|nr:hypothetical protein [Candidatus Woesearchaeota archaeon]
MILTLAGSIRTDENFSNALRVIEYLGSENIKLTLIDEYKRRDSILNPALYHDSCFNKLKNSDAVIVNLEYEDTGLGAIIADAFFLEKEIFIVSNTSFNNLDLSYQKEKYSDDAVHFLEYCYPNDLCSKIEKYLGEIAPKRTVKTQDRLVRDISRQSLKEGSIISDIINSNDRTVVRYFNFLSVPMYLYGKRASPLVKGNLTFIPYEHC